MLSSLLVPNGNWLGGGGGGGGGGGACPPIPMPIVKAYWTCLGQ